MKKKVSLKLSKQNFLILLALSLLIILASLIINSQIKKEDKSKTQYIGCVQSNLSGDLNFSETYALFEGRNIEIPKIAYNNNLPSVLGVAYEEKWIEIDLSEQKLKAWEGERLFLETSVSTGLPWWPTPTGEFRIWIKLRAAKMEGGSGKYYYYLPNVPYIMYFENDQIPSWRGFGLHGTYWHSDFGTQRSHGCVNLPTNIAKELYYWTSPTLPDGKSTVYSNDENLGTRIVIHE